MEKAKEFYTLSCETYQDKEYSPSCQILDCDNNIPSGCYRLGDLYSKNNMFGPDQNFTRSNMYYKKACDLDYIPWLLWFKS